MSNIFNTCIYLKFILEDIDKCDECTLLTTKLNAEEVDKTHAKFCYWDTHTMNEFRNNHECTEYHIPKDIYTFDDLRGAIKEHESIWYYEHDKLEVSMNYILDIINYLEKK